MSNIAFFNLPIRLAKTLLNYQPEARAGMKISLSQSGSLYRSGQKPEGTCREAARQKKTGAADISSLPTKRLMSHEKPRRRGKNSSSRACYV